MVQNWPPAKTAKLKILYLSYGHLLYKSWYSRRAKKIVLINKYVECEQWQNKTCEKIMNEKREILSVIFFYF